jgi:ubiquinone/menaquinone biosynthesis C-methylase UbiE
MRLNLGCGYQDAPRWEHVDVRDYGHNVVADVLDGLPYAARTFDYAVLGHFLQMFTYEQHPVVLAELKRVLKPGGVVRILVPDLMSALLAFQNLDRSYFPIASDLESTLSGAFARYLFWHGDTRSAFEFFSLADLFQRNGFTVLGGCDFGQTLSEYREITELDSREPESLVMEFRA